MGAYQWILLVALSWIHMICGMQAMLFVFVGLPASHPGSQDCPPAPVPPEHVGRSLVADYGLVCEKADYAAVISATFFVGFLIGAPLFGWLSDRVGRKAALLSAACVVEIATVAAALSSTVIMFGVSRLVIGVAVGGLNVGAFVLVAEFLGAQRSFGALSAGVAFAIGIGVLSAVAWAFPLWRTECWVLVGLQLFIFPVVGMAHESPKWQLSAGYEEAAKETLIIVAKFNGMPGPVWQHVQPSQMEQASLSTLFKPPLSLRMSVMSVAWFAVAMAYYGLALGAGQLGPNVYVSNALGAAVELPAKMLFVAAVDNPYVGRRLLATAGFLSGGAACVYGGTLPPGSVSLLAAALAGRFGIAFAFGTLYVWGSELFPTPIRNSSLGAQSMFARAAGICAPFVLTLSSSPLVVLGVPAIAAGLLCLLLPETLGRKLPDSVEDLQEAEEKPLIKRQDVC